MLQGNPRRIKNPITIGLILELTVRKQYIVDGSTLLHPSHCSATRAIEHHVHCCLIELRNPLIRHSHERAVFKTDERWRVT